MSSAGTTRPDLPRPSLPSRVWRGIKRALVILLVTYHLLFFAIRNPLDLWYEPIRDWWKEEPRLAPYYDEFRLVDQFTYRYANTAGCEQGWAMFTPPMARKAPFLGVRFEFDDGTTHLKRSPNEPNPARFFRFGGWQQRKLEDCLMWPPDELDAAPGWPLWEGYARYVVNAWRREHPDDPRAIRRLVFVRRDIHFPGPDDPPGTYEEPEERELVAFHPDGRLWK